MYLFRPRMLSPVWMFACLFACLFPGVSIFLAVFVTVERKAKTGWRLANRADKMFRRHLWLAEQIKLLSRGRRKYKKRRNYSHTPKSWSGCFEITRHATGFAFRSFKQTAFRFASCVSLCGPAETNLFWEEGKGSPRIRGRSLRVVFVIRPLH